MNRRGGWLLALALCFAVPVSAKGWDPLSYALRMDAFGTSDAFPGSINSGPDKGIAPAVEIATGRRLSRTLKFGASASAGGNVQGEFTRANYGYFGLGTQLRRNRTSFALDGQWTPKRNKFPTDPEEGGEFHNLQLTATVRHALNPRTRLRLGGIFERDKYVPLFAPRDAWGHEVFGSVTFTPARGTDLHAEGDYTRDVASSARYNKTQRWLGAGVALSDSSWRADVSARSGLRHYPENIAGESNYQRRDQWIELRLRVSRILRPGLSATIGASVVDQTSSRTDRNFNAHTFSLGLEWTGGGK